MGVRILDNAGKFLKGYDRLAPRRKRHTLDLVNNMKYAEPLHNKEGYYVFNDEHFLKTAREWILETLRAGHEITDVTVVRALDGAGFEAVKFLRSKTSTMRPPIRADQGSRQAHPGGWGDVTSNLANAYHHKVNGRRGTGS